MLTQEELRKYIQLMDVLPPNSPQIPKIRRLLQEDKKERCRENFMPFVQEMWAAFISGRHHKIMADAFERVASGDLKRLIINMPPRHTKSEFASYLFPAWFLGKYPEKKIIQTAHTAELAVGFGRKVRNIVNTPEYQAIFPTKLSADSKAAGRWNTNKGGDYFAIGVGGAVTGKGADVLIIDDPHSEQEAMQNNPAVYDRVFEWYNAGPRQRLQPGGAIVIVMCMTGDTNVLMADGTNKKLKDVRAGDMVATYENGYITTSKINNWRSSGVDSIYQVKTQSGIILRANERHPFLVDFSGERKWIRLKDLKPGMRLVSMKDATDPLGLKQSLHFAGLAKPVSRTIAKILMPHTAQSAVMECGKALNAVWAAVKKRFQAVGYVPPTTAKSTHPRSLLKRLEGIVSSTATALPLSSMNRWFKSVGTFVMSAVNHRQATIPVLTGMANFALTTATTQGSFVGFCATTATLRLDTEKPQKSLSKPLNTYAVTTDPIVEIIPAGQEEVFDVEVDRTENFIANGVVSHNTRWSKRDLTGQILNNASKRETDEWEVIEFPALMPSGKPLWEEFWSQKELEAIKQELPVSKWEAQYQQNPTSEEGAIIKREMWQIWEHDEPPVCEYIIQSWDTAFEKSTRADYSACTTWGVFRKENEQGEYVNHIILLEALKDRMEFPELKRKAYEKYKEWNPDTLIIEKKAAGAPLVYEMRQMGIPVQEYTPSKGNDKIARVNAISDLFSSGYVWCPQTRWADEVMEECASFPNGDHDDLVDSTSQALLRFRQGGFLRLNTDEPDEERTFKRRVEYY